MIVIKVQLRGIITTNGIVNTDGCLNQPFVCDNNWLTFLAFSHEMKSKVLDIMAAKKHTVAISVYEGKVKCGEWFEPLVENAVICESCDMV